MKFYWNPESVSVELNTMLETVKNAKYNLNQKTGDIQLNITLSDNDFLVVKKTGKTVNISGKNISAIMRGVGMAFANLECHESTPFSLLGVMIDCSRNKVFTVEYLKKYILQMALMGYNTMLLYTEDTYKLPDEPFFGYMRGGYSLSEIQELDQYASKLGVELIGCIQTLGHLEQILQWDCAYASMTDTAKVVLVDEPKTYELIRKMVDFWSKALKTKRIHIGMDETQDLGRGTFMNKFGHESGFDIFNRHLAKVNEICQEFGFLNPTIWSDMYFRMGNERQDYYFENPSIPDDVIAKIPKNVQLCYWDYYNTREDFYDQYITYHQKINPNTIMASGVWTWCKLWSDLDFSKQTIKPCVKMCRKNNLKEIFFTMWGDDGGYCLYSSSLAGLAYAANLAYDCEDEQRTGKLFEAITKNNYELYKQISLIESGSTGKNASNYPVVLLWDDPLLAIAYRGRLAGNANYGKNVLKDLKATLKVIEDSKTPKSNIEVNAIYYTIDFIISKLEFRIALEKAYLAKDKEKLAQLIKIDLPLVLKKSDKFSKTYRQAWLSCAKVFGLEVIQKRNAGVKERLKEVATRVNEYLDGKISTIDELDASCGAAETEYYKTWYGFFSSGSFIK